MCAVCMCGCVSVQVWGMGTVSCQGRAVIVGGEPWALGLTDVMSALLPLQDWSNRRAERDKSKQVMVSRVEPT